MTFSLPGEARINREYLNFYRLSHKLGSQSAIPPDSNLGVAIPAAAIATRSRLAAKRLVNKIEGDLRFEWERSLVRQVDQPMLIYQTQKVFAEIVGWEPPDAPE